MVYEWTDTVKKRFRKIPERIVGTFPPPGIIKTWQPAEVNNTPAIFAAPFIQNKQNEPGFPWLKTENYLYVTI